MTVRHEPGKPAREAMEEAIRSLGYGAEEPGAAPEPAPEAAPPPEVPVPATAASVPEALRDVFEKARAEGKLVLIKFSAEWCLPCKQMSKVTLEDPAVKALVEEGFVFREVDTDKEPGIGRALGVSGIPDLRILGPDGTEVDRRVGYEPPAEFATRLRRARGAR
ncbi:MAG: thioredoxin family protein [Planctomycetales bacterium]|nr:thioredoxin family protein [Planctomycetales bacterium]